MKRAHDWRSPRSRVPHRRSTRDLGALVATIFERLKDTGNARDFSLGEPLDTCSNR